MFEWYVVRCGSKNGQKKDVCLKKIKLHAQNILTILVSIVNRIGGEQYDHLMSTGIFTLIMNENIHMTSENDKNNGYGHNMDLLSSRTNCLYHILQEVGAERKVSD
jgi:hypothetical protein